MNSIQTKFILLILSCVFLCSVVIGGSAILNTKKVIDIDSTQLMHLQCSEGTERLNGLLGRIEQSVKTLAAFTLEELHSVERIKTDANYLKEYTRRLEAVAINAANNTEGAVAVYIRFNPEFTPPDSGLFWSKTKTNNQFQKLAPTNLSNYSPSDIEHVGWYYIPIQNGSSMWMTPYFNQNINISMISYVIPIYKENEVIGIVGMDIDFSVFEKLVSELNIYDTGYAFLCDKQGKVMYHPQYPLNTKIDSVDNSLQLLTKELKNKISSSNLFNYKYNNEDKRMAYRTLNNGMLLAVTAPLKEIDAIKNVLIVQNIIAIIIISTIFLLITIYVTRKIIRPLRELNCAAKKIAEGNLNISLTQESQDEVGMLAESFRQTVNHLQKYINYINSLAYRDALTGVKNKTAYQEVTRRLEEQMKLGQPRFAIVVMDINNLKEINDRYGHDFGDILIIDACKFICKIFKHSPVYRIGGDEFVVILENGDFENYAQLMEDFCLSMEEYNNTTHPDNKISIARGIAIYNSESDLVFADIFKRADDAMYQNKATMKRKSKSSENEKIKNI